MKTANELMGWENDSSDWVWKHALHLDTQDIVKMAEQNFQYEIDGIFTPEPVHYAYSLDCAITEQCYYYNKQLLIVCRNKSDDKLLAYSWVKRGIQMPFSQDEMAEVWMAHCDLELSTRKRIKIISEMIIFWERWATACDIPVLVSSTIRQETKSFMRIHERLGFTVRNSIAYKRLKGKENETT